MYRKFKKIAAENQKKAYNNGNPAPICQGTLGEMAEP